MKTKTAKTFPSDKIAQSTQNALDFLKHRNPLKEHWTDVQYKMKLAEYILAKGEDALKALAGFYIWSMENLKPHEKPLVIPNTFAHDLGQMYDEWMSPRSSGYLKYYDNRK